MLPVFSREGAGVGIERPLLIELPDEWVGEKIVLRPWRDADADALFSVIRASADHIARWLPWSGEHRTAGDTLEFIRRTNARWIAREGLDGLGIFRRADGAILGGTGMHVLSWKIPAFEIGYWLAADAEGHGYISESVRLLTTFAFESLHAERLVIRCDAENRRSAAVAERNGFAFEGRLRRDSLATDGTLRDTFVFAMIRTDYDRARARWSEG